MSHGWVQRLFSASTTVVPGAVPTSDRFSKYVSIFYKEWVHLMVSQNVYNEGNPVWQKFQNAEILDIYFLETTKKSHEPNPGDIYKQTTIPRLPSSISFTTLMSPFIP